MVQTMNLLAIRLFMWPLAIPVLALLLVIFSCTAAQRPPAQAMQAAELAIAAADKARIAGSVAPELDEARDKLTAAHTAVKEKKMDLAKQLAEQSRADAELSTARTEAAKARAINEEMQKGSDALQQEMQRNSGARP